MRTFGLVLSALALAACAHMPIAAPAGQSDWDHTLEKARRNVAAGSARRKDQDRKRDNTKAEHLSRALHGAHKVDDDRADHQDESGPDSPYRTHSLHRKCAIEAAPHLPGTCARTRTFLLQPLGALDAEEASTRPEEEAPRLHRVNKGNAGGHHE